MIYVALDYLEVPATGKNNIAPCYQAPDFQRKKNCHCNIIALSRPLLKAQLKYSNNLNHKGNRALGTGK